MSLKKSAINEYFDQVYVINLEKRTDRKIAMLQKLNRLGIQAEFVQAVDGHSLQNKLEYQAYLETPIGRKGSHQLEFEFQRKMIDSSGAWACLKSYFAVLEDAKKKNHQRILCLEDDIIFHKDFENQFIQATQKIKDDWKLLYLGASQYLWRIPEGLSYRDKNKVAFDLEEPYYFPKRTDGAFAIGIHCSVFDLLLQQTSKMNCAFDSGPLRAVNKVFPNKCFVLTPNIIIADVSESDIRGKQDVNTLANQLNWNLEAYDFPFRKDLVSVIMPAYNAEKTMEKSIRSILLQTYSELELIVVDDASTDQTATIVKALAKEDSRIRLISLNENKGVGAARNEGLKASTGAIIAIQDADDISLKQRLEKQLIPIYEKGILFTASRIYRSRCTPEQLDIFDQKSMMSLIESKRVIKKSGHVPYEDQAVVALVTTVFQRSVFEKYGLFEEHRFGEDMEFLERFLFFKTGTIFNKKYNAHSFINYGESQILEIFERLEEVLLISPQLNKSNLTTQFKNKQKETQLNEQRFREKYRSHDLSIFPKLIPIKTQAHHFPSFKYNTLIIDEMVMIPQSTYRQLVFISEKAILQNPSDKMINPFIFELKKFIKSPLHESVNLFKRFISSLK